MTRKASLNTCAVRAGLGADAHHGAVVPPLHLSSTFTFDGFEGKRQYDYSRSGNPTRDALGDALSELEGGVGATITSSGMSALTLTFQLFEPGELIIAPHDCYGGTHRLLTALDKRGHCRVRFVDQTNERALIEAFLEKPRAILVETPSNPLLRITDIAAVVRLAQLHGTLVIADNTFLSPGWQRPLSLGADIVVHSTTKYLNGHSDVVGGAVVASTDELHEQLTWWGNCLGLTGAPFDSFLTLRGLRTLNARLAVHEQNAYAVVALLNEHPAVRKVYFPGLATHPGHQIAARQQSAFGAMVSFELHGGRRQVKAFLHGLRHFFLAESLGGVESLVAHPATMTHAAMSPEAQAIAGITDSLLRLSVGIECADDLVADVRSGLERAAAVQAAFDTGAVAAVAHC